MATQGHASNQSPKPFSFPEPRFFWSEPKRIVDVGTRLRRNMGNFHRFDLGMRALRYKPDVGQPVQDGVQTRNCITTDTREKCIRDICKMTSLECVLPRRNAIIYLQFILSNLDQLLAWSRGLRSRHQIQIEFKIQVW